MSASVCVNRISPSGGGGGVTAFRLRLLDRYVLRKFVLLLGAHAEKGRRR